MSAEKDPTVMKCFSNLWRFCRCRTDAIGSISSEHVEEKANQHSQSNQLNSSPRAAARHHLRTFATSSLSIGFSNSPLFARFFKHQHLEQIVFFHWYLHWLCIVLTKLQGPKCCVVVVVVAVAVVVFYCAKKRLLDS